MILMNNDYQITGIDELRGTLNLMNNCRESFCQRFSAAELIQLARRYRECDFDIAPDYWTPSQVLAGLAGVVPKWDENDDPIESPYWVAKAAAR